jgi:hypothetical protein
MKLRAVLVALSCCATTPLRAADSGKSEAAAPRPAIEVDFTFVRFPTAEIEARARKSDSASVSSEEVLAMWKAGRGVMVSEAKVVAEWDATAENRQVHAIIYPGEFARLQGTNVLAPELETREVGTIVKASPRQDAGSGFFTLALAAELTELAQWEAYDAKVELPDRKAATFRAKVPIFRSASVDTRIPTREGETVVLGLGSDLESKQTLYLLVHTQLAP